MARLTGQDAQVYVYSGGELIKTIAPLSFSVSTILESEHVSRLGSRSSTVETAGPVGHEGDIEFDITSASLDIFEDLVIERHLAGGSHVVLDIIQIIAYPDGTSKRYTYPNAVFTPSTSYSGGRDAVKKSYKWKSELRKEL